MLLLYIKTHCKYNSNNLGLTVARSGSRSINGSVYAALMSNIWETFERQGIVKFKWNICIYIGIRDDLREVVIQSETGTIAVVRVANMLLAIIADNSVPVGILKAKLSALSEHLRTPLSAML